MGTTSGSAERGTLFPPTLRRGRVHTRRVLRQHGVSERRLGSSDFPRVLPGCYAVGEGPAELREVARVAQRIVVPGSVISHVTAAELIGLPVPTRLTRGGGEPVHCTVEPVRKRASARGLKIHVRAGRRSVPFEGLTIAHPVDILLDLAPLLSLDELVACIDSLGSMRRENIRVPVETIRIAARTVSGRGVRALRAAAREARDAVDSPRETQTRLMLLRAGYPEPEINRPIIDPATDKEYRIDLAYARWKIAIEYDGKDHFTLKQKRSDHYKDELLHREGWTVLRLTVDDHIDSRDFFLRLDDMIAQAETRLLDGPQRDPTIPGD